MIKNQSDILRKMTDYISHKFASGVTFCKSLDRSIYLVGILILSGLTLAGLANRIFGKPRIHRVEENQINSSIITVSQEI